jgi:hypothetical protein
MWHSTRNIRADHNDNKSLTAATHDLSYSLGRTIRKTPLPTVPVLLRKHVYRATA